LLGLLEDETVKRMFSCVFSTVELGNNKVAEVAILDVVRVLLNFTFSDVVMMEAEVIFT